MSFLETDYIIIIIDVRTRVQVPFLCIRTLELKDSHHLFYGSILVVNEEREKQAVTLRIGPLTTFLYGHDRVGG